MYVHRNNLVAECDAAAATNGGTAANVVNTFVVVIIHCVRVAQFHSKDFREELLIDFVSARLSADIGELESCRKMDFVALATRRGGRSCLDRKPSCEKN
jgi:hypothetical protein